MLFKLKAKWQFGEATEKRRFQSPIFFKNSRFSENRLRYCHTTLATQPAMLVVRVKRRRDEQPSESICVVGDDNEDYGAKRRKPGLIEQMQAQLTMEDTLDEIEAKQTPPTGTNGAKHIVLHRMATLVSGTRSHLDEETKLFLGGSRPRPDEDQAEAQPRKRGKLVVTQTRSRLTVNEQSCVVVDMMQLPSEEAGPAGQPAAASPAKTSQRILDPPTRELEQGITAAMQRGDFNQLSTGLIKGANPNHQLPMDKGGQTALMAAAAKVNLRMVNRLLMADVDPTLRDSSGRTAADLIKETSQNQREAKEVRQLLQSALIKHYQFQRQIEAKQHRRVHTEAVNNEEYVVDVFVIAADAATAPGAGPATSTAASAANEAEQQAIKIEGLRILDDGQVDLLVYDSDWSDLADDEDPDSNDERFDGNDYPEDEDSDVDAPYQNDDASDSEDEDRERGQFRAHRAHISAAVAATHKGKGASMYDDLVYQDADADVPLFHEVNRIGKVMHEQYIDGTAAAHNTESLQELWDVQNQPQNAHEERIEQMRQRTGMVFASKPNEFTPSGLAKYGMDLSDDEMDEDVLLGAAYGKQGKGLPKDMVAYDSELDAEEDD